MNYLKDSIEEIKKVTWPTSNQAVKLTIITVIFVVIFTALITALDYGFSKGYDFLIDVSPKASATRAAQQAEMDLDLEELTQSINFDTSAIQATDADGNPVELDISPVSESSTDSE